jgi:multiple sugar transport system permease protein
MTGASSAWLARLAAFFTLSRRRMLWGYVFLLVPFGYLLIVRIIPTFISLNMSLRHWSVLSPDRTWVGLDNFVRLASDDRFWFSLRNTLAIAAIAVPTQILLALGISLLLNRITRFRGLFRLIYFVPFMTVLPAVARVWRWAYVPEIGTINVLLQVFGLPTQPFLQSPKQALYAIIAVIIWQGLGFAVVITLAGLNQIPRVFYEAAELDGASAWQQLRHITVPLLNTTLVFLAITLTIAALQTFTLVFIMQSGSGHDLGGPLNSTRTLVLHIYDYGFKRYEMGYASAITVVMLVIMMVFAITQITLLNRRIEY